MHLALRVLEVVMPSLTAKRVAYIELTKATVEKRLDTKTDRKDIMTYASLSLFSISVGVHQWSAYRSSANFANPDTFDPERWMAHPPSKYRNDNKAAFQPFSLGPRGCIGKSLAYFELRSIMARMLWHFDMQLESESQRWTDMKEYMVWYKPPLWVKLSHRADL
ncbi:MAG: hypothetical protein LQ349_007562 [Xanthoria aureola]|nr:MAG: hypothetical protein LQ349_007562 [Xanthoria aureola]